MRLRLVMSIVAVVCLAAAASAIAGKSVTGGGRILQFSSGASPAKANKITTLHLVFSDKTTSGQRTLNGPRTITFNMAGFTVKPGAIPVCKLSALIAANGAGCDSSQVGAGTATADARPTLPNPVSATVTIYYGSDDVAPGGKPRPGRPAFLVKASALGQVSYYPFDISPGKFSVDLGPNPTPGKLPLFELVASDVRVAKVVQAPSRCKGSWSDSVTFTYDSGRPLTAKDKIPCKKK